MVIFLELKKYIFGNYTYFTVVMNSKIVKLNMEKYR